MTLKLPTTDSYAITHQGNVRSHNEDACLDLPQRGVWVVADGMGGHAQGDYASQLIVQKVQSLGEFDRPSDKIDALEQTLQGVNTHLFTKSSSAPEPTIIGSTVVALAAFDRFGVFTWAGDSRAYRLRDGTLAQVTRDHSEVQDLVDQGLVKAEEAELHPQANVVTRAVGGTSELYLDYRLTELAKGDRFLLCSDGLFKDVPETEIAELLGKGNAASCAQGLIDVVLGRECRDNVTVIIVDIEALPAATAADEEPAEEDVPGEDSADEPSSDPDRTEPPSTEVE